MKNKTNQTHKKNPLKKTRKSNSLKMKNAGGHSFGKSSFKNPLGHLRSALAQDEDCLSRL